MITWFRRLISHDRLQKANEKLDAQYEELADMECELDRLGKKLDELKIVTEDSTRVQRDLRQTVSGQMPAVALEKFRDEEAPTNPLIRHKLPSGT